MLDVISLGQLVADVVVKPVEGFPQKGTAGLVSQIKLHSGGCALNTANTLGKLELKAGAVGKVGDEIFGDFLISEMNACGVNTEGVKKDHNANTSSVIVMVSSNGERTFLYCPGATEELTIDDIDFSLIEHSKILHIGGVMKLPKLDVAAVLKKAKDFAVTTSLDTDWDPTGRWLSLVEPCLRYVDIFTPSMDEAKMIFGKNEPQEIMKTALSYGIGIVALKMGEAGCYIKTEDDGFHIPAYKVNVTDTTGAGDSFVGGFLTGIAKGWDLRESGIFANAVGALCVTALGATTGVKGFDETMAFMKNQRPDV